MIWSTISYHIYILFIGISRIIVVTGTLQVFNHLGSKLPRMTTGMSSLPNFAAKLIRYKYFIWDVSDQHA